MSPRDYINEIKVLDRKNIHIKNKENVNRILNSIIAGGSKKLQIVFDFDRTITKQHENGKAHLSSFSMFRHCKSITKEFLEVEEALKNKYYPLEICPTISKEEKTKYMEEWWLLSENVFKGLTTPPEEIEEVAKLYGPSLRDGTQKVFKNLNNNNVPILVFSAGLGDCIVAVLKHFNVLYPAVKVISNFLKYNNSGEIEGFKSKPLHVFNKNEYALQGTEYFELVQDRENVIVLGDSLGDAGMADGMPHCNSVLKIGFLYDHINENLEIYKDTFDIVLEDDQTMDVLSAILEFIL